MNSSVFFDSPTGRRLRKGLATGLILSVPFVMRIPVAETIADRTR